MSFSPTGPADLRDQRWLDERVESARSGIESVIDIALNWTAGRQVGRLHPGVAPAEYIREHVGLVGREAIVPLLTESNWSNRQIAVVAGVDEGTVRNQLRKVPQLERPPETLGADGRLRPPTPFRPRLDPTRSYFPPTPEQVAVEEPPTDASVWNALTSVMDDIEGLTDSDAAYVAATVPVHRRAATAKRLRKLGTYLGRIAWTLEGNEEPK